MRKLKNIRGFSAERVRTLSLLSGSLIIAAWTLLRFFNQSPSFDQFGQQVLAHQWLHGVHSGSVIGPTNYVLKMLFLYIPLDVLPLPAHFKIIFMTLLVNILTFVLLAYVLKLTWDEFFPDFKNSFYLPLLYLTLISGSVYWISFSNSRNLEVAGGVFLIYLYIRAQTSPSRRKYAAMVILGSLLFFADPLQVYMTLVPVLVFVGWQAFARHKRGLTPLLKIAGCAIISVLAARLLARAAESIWHISFINSGQSVSFQLSSIKSSADQLARLYAGGFEGGRLREAINLLVLLGGAAAAIYYSWRKPKARRLMGLVATVWVIDLGVYIVSGQARQADTNRYLIMTVPMTILALSLVLYYWRPAKIRTYAVVFVLLLNSLTLAKGFVQAWDPHFANDSHDRSVINYLRGHHYPYGYASIGTAVSSDYLSGWDTNLLTLGCDPGRVLKKTNLFFDKGAFKIEKRVPGNAIVPIILDGDSIRINQDACGPDDIERQLGPWQKLDRLDDGSTVLLYESAQASSF